MPSRAEPPRHDFMQRLLTIRFYVALVRNQPSGLSGCRCCETHRSGLQDAIITGTRVFTRALHGPFVGRLGFLAPELFVFSFKPYQARCRTSGGRSHWGT
jgi:hypothetical protein